jgi:putative tricarboxylic transport membrane protein
VSQLVSEVEDPAKVRGGETLVPGRIVFEPWKSLRDVAARPINLVRSSLVGVFIGAVPGAGGSIANLLAYDQARRASTDPQRFGTGIPEGVVASESGNSSTAGGGLIPLIALGIPGSAVDAILMASLMVHGISVGPRLIMDQAELVYGMFVAMAIAAVLMVLICMVSMRWFLRVTDVPQYVIVPVVLTCCVLGAFALNNRLTDIYLLAGIGLVGYALRKLDYPLAPLVLGVILGPIAETNLRRALMANEDWTAFLTRPVSAGLLALAVVSIALSLRSWRRLKAVEGGT